MKPNDSSAAAHPAQLPAEARILAALPFGVGYMQGEVFAWVNDELARILHAKSPAEVAGTNVFDVIAPQDLLKVRQRYEARRRGEPVPPAYEITVLCKDGERAYVEIEPRPISETEFLVVVRDLRDTVRDRDLLAALSELSSRVQRAGTVAGVTREAANGLLALGFQAAIFRIDADVAACVECAIGVETYAFLLRTTGRAPLELRVPVASSPNVMRALESGRALFIDDPLPSMVNLLRITQREIPDDYVAMLNATKLAKLVVAPLLVGEHRWGFLCIAAARLRSADAAAVSLFAQHVSSALEVARSIEELERQNRQLDAIRRIAAIRSDLSFEAQIDEVLREVKQATASDAAGVYLLDADSQTMTLAGASGIPEHLLAKYRQMPHHPNATESMRAIALERSALPEPIKSDTEAAGHQASAIVPLHVGGRLAGTLNLARFSPQSYTPEDLRGAEMLGNQVAVQVERARLQAEARQRVDELSLFNELGAQISQHLSLDHVLKTALSNVSRIVHVPNTFLLMLSRCGKMLETVATNVDDPIARELKIPVDATSAAGAAVKTGKPVAIDDAHNDGRTNRPLASRFGHTSLLAVPLIAGDKPLGALVLGETRGPRQFSAADVERALAVANQVGTAIENARLYEQQRRRVEQLRLLLDMSQVITGSLELGQILAESAQSLARMIDATDTFIWLLEGESLRGVVASSPDLHDHFSQVRIHVSQPTAVGLAIEKRTPVRIENASESHYVNQELNARYRQKSLLALPLMLRDVPIGAISIGDRRTQRPFTDDEVEGALLISRQVAVAIDNARLYEDLKRSYHELSRAQQELVKRERLAALGELSAVVAHEVRNPLGVIFNSLASLKRVLPQTDDAKMLLGIVAEEADRLNRMVSDLLDFARPNEAQLRPECLEDVLSGALESAARAMPSPQIQVSLECSPELPAVPVDAQMIRQAVLNLVVNAVQAMPRGGNVKVRAGIETRGMARFARIEVEDDGPGIPAELADRVFQPFFTTKAAGTGLGLAVVKRIADAHRAEVTVRSNPGQGSTFTLWIPA